MSAKEPEPDKWKPVCNVAEVLKPEVSALLDHLTRSGEQHWGRHAENAEGQGIPIVDH
jgi:hypothetical protein